MSGILVMWTVYDHPSDFPDAFVARRFEVAAGGFVTTETFITSPDIETLRNSLQGEFLCTDRLPRHPNDDPKIVEVWLAESIEPH
jgi:hypothetical protein